MDEDDPQLADYYTCLNGVGQVLAVTPGRAGMVAALQSGFDSYKDHLGYAVGFMGDDHRPRTIGWDQQYLDSLRSITTGFVYGNDLFQFENIPTQIAMSTDIPLALGYMCPPEFDHLCVDVVWKDWGNSVGKLIYLRDVVVEHVHYLANKSKFDKTYAIVNNQYMANHDAAAYREYCDSGRMAEDCQRIAELL